ncbi:MAG: RNA polymerase sigma factor (sigma-70 family) [Cyclobacteriaceae bacterium]
MAYISNLKLLTNEEHLLVGLKSGDQKILKQVYESNYSAVEKMILKNSGTSDDAKDMFQDAMVIFYKNIQKSDFVLSSSIKTYLYAISWRLWMKKIREEKKLTITHKEEYIDAFDFELVSKDPDATLNGVVELLKQHGKNCLEILTRFYFNNQSFDFIASELGYASGQVVREQKYRCIKRVREGIKSSNMSYEFE